MYPKFTGSKEKHQGGDRMRTIRAIRQGLAAMVMVWPFSTALAHEVTPAVGNFMVQNGRLELTLRVNAEALLSGMDLDGLNDTDAAEDTHRYTRLRALDDAALADRLRQEFAQVIGPVAVQVDGRAVSLKLRAIEVQPAPGPNFARPTMIVMDGMPRADGPGDMVLNWPKGYGRLVLRQNGVDNPFVGTFQGGDQAGPIPLGDGLEMTFWQKIRARLGV
jgi:hypothetical protein